MKGAVVNALNRVIQHGRTVLPSWIVIRSIKKHFDWRKELDDRQILVGVIHALMGVVAMLSQFTVDLSTMQMRLLRFLFAMKH
jgi:hypothetical protein